MEGGHHCKAASQTLQGFQLGDFIPLTQNPLDVPLNSTLFKPVHTQVYFCQNDDVNLDKTVLKYLQGISWKVANQKNLIVQTTWHNFFDHVVDDINGHGELQEELFETSDDFFAEEVTYKQISSKNLRSNIIKKYLHEILTNAIFNYHPCKDLLDVFDESVKPKIEDWGSDTNK